KITISNSFSSPWASSGTSMYPASLANSVGIGTSTPSYKLHVVGTGYVSDNFSVGGAFNVAGNTTLDGDVTLGNEDSDVVIFSGRIASGTALLPVVDLGSDL